MNSLELLNKEIQSLNFKLRDLRKREEAIETLQDGTRFHTYNQICEERDQVIKSRRKAIHTRESIKTQVAKIIMQKPEPSVWSRLKSVFT